MTYHIDVSTIQMTSAEKEELLERRHTTWETTGNLSEHYNVRIAREAYFTKDGNGIVEFTIVDGGLEITRHPLPVLNCAYRMTGEVLEWWAPLTGGWEPCEKVEWFPEGGEKLSIEGADGDGEVIRRGGHVIAVEGIRYGVNITPDVEPMDLIHVVFTYRPKCNIQITQVEGRSCMCVKRGVLYCSWVEEALPPMLLEGFGPPTLAPFDHYDPPMIMARGRTYAHGIPRERFWKGDVASWIRSD